MASCIVAEVTSKVTVPEEQVETEDDEDEKDDVGEAGDDETEETDAEAIFGEYDFLLTGCLYHYHVLTILF